MEMRQSAGGHKCQNDNSGGQSKTMILNMELVMWNMLSSVLKKMFLLLIMFVLSSLEP